MPDKGNELTVICQLLSDLELAGRVVSINALACQTDIAQTIAEGNGWYLLAVKDNQADLHAHLQRDFAYLDRTGAVAHDRSETAEWGHGRLERRTCTLMVGTRGLWDELDPDHRWTDLNCAVRHYITNLPVTIGAARVTDLVRGHWGVENSLHWVLDNRTAAACVRTMPPATGPPAAHCLELPDAHAAVFLTKNVNPPITQAGGPQPRPTGSDHGPVTTLSTPWDQRES